MLPKYGAERISKALFETDPMNTCCKENDCFDEYDRIATGIEESLAGGQSLKQAMAREIAEWFFDGEGFDTIRLKPTLELLGKEEQ